MVHSPIAVNERIQNYHLLRTISALTRIVTDLIFRGFVEAEGKIHNVFNTGNTVADVTPERKLVTDRLLDAGLQHAEREGD